MWDAVANGGEGNTMFKKVTGSPQAKGEEQEEKTVKERKKKVKGFFGSGFFNSE